MPNDAYSWTCPYCGRATTLTEPNYATDWHRIELALGVSEHGKNIGLVHVARACPNTACKKLELEVRLWTLKRTSQQLNLSLDQEIHSWELLPESSAKPQPNYIPKSLRDDYVEACRIASLSPKASATLSRRCLQGMIRGFWKTPKKPNLKQEIEAIKDKVDTGTWQAIDAVRSVGNIGAHMEQNIDIIVEVDPGEADLLIGLIETLFSEWYVHRHEREKRMKAIVDLAADKGKARSGKGPPKTGGAGTPKGKGKSA